MCIRDRALRLQHQVRTAIFDGWRPLTAQARGGRPPLTEHAFPSAWLRRPSTPNWLLTPATDQGKANDDTIVPTASDKVADDDIYSESEPSDDDAEASKDSDKLDRSEAYIFNNQTGIIHSAIVAPPDY